MRVIDVVQGTEEWKVARAGKITASRIQAILDSTKAGWRNYLAQLVCERLTGVPYEGFQSKEMKWGIETEPEARAVYSMEYERCDTVGFVLHPEWDFSGASPDGLCLPDHGVEIKCPNTATHLDTLENRRVPSDYFAQMQWCMLCTGLDGWRYVSYDPRIRVAKLQMVVMDVERDQRWLDNTSEKVYAFNSAVDEKIARIMEAAQP